MESYEEKDTKVHIPAHKEFKIIFNLLSLLALVCCEKLRRYFQWLVGTINNNIIINKFRV